MPVSEWAPRRFWQAAHVVAVKGGYAVRLDTRPLRTPAKATLVVPTMPLAAAIALEWDALSEVISPRAMPLTRAANTAIDTVAPNLETVMATVASYGESDLLCYRAQTPAELRRRQEAAWDPLLGWTEAELHARLVTTEGVIHRAQPEPSLAMLRREVARFDGFALTGLHDLVTLSGSLVIGLAAVAGEQTPEELWQASRVDEDWQAEQWGEDAEAAEQTAQRRQAFFQAMHFVRLVTDGRSAS